jgi:hypothetical protein
MLSLISSVFGFLMSGLPKVFEYFQDRADKAHELKLANIQTERDLAMAREGFIAQQRVEEIRTEQIAMQTDADRQAAALADNSKLMERVSQKVADLNGVVRPMVTFIFVAELVAINFALTLWVFMNGTVVNSIDDLVKVTDVIFSEDEMALLSGIIAFWFGSRQWGKK